ncbi:ABC-type branched-subunit amino acid transport system substrate-binding protein [Streptomyces sp. SAI-133]|uniref:ABC transporter substrate-binding protein n=1 Tax=unclassified Streptomyces TaxID=2593676 RepID=UPI002475E5B8|nr:MULTISPECIES: ABC transporter substrate-binding protein [unclassified Streptomyces]MDH6547711.1 ABC-type branched-subunit amino acid transport system substrate-binding protein [Streptomyces sp. SAI-041]MDH6588263.1 ABC-type branched-subunit amino acid transport system substrate-binding protein [Streptomyces sp. SAI-133]
MIRTYGARAAAGALAALLVLAGCSSKAKDSDEGDGGKGAAGGVKTGEGISGKTITLGALTDMTGVYATLGKSVTQAQQLYVKQLNAAGGVCGYKLDLAVRDHGYDPQKAVSGYTELEPKVLGFTQFIGSPFVAAVKQRVDGQDKGLVLPQAWSSALLGSPYIRVIGSTYDIETMNAIDFLIKEKGIGKGDKIGHVYFEGDYGESALVGSKHIAKEAGLTVVEQKIKPTDNDMTAQVTALKQAGVKAIVLSAGPRQAASLVGVAAASGFAVPVIGNNSAFAPQLLATQAGPALMKNYYVASPSLPIGADTPRAKKLVADYRAAYPKDALDNGIVAGWTAAAAFGEALKEACANKDLTRAGVGKALLSIDSYDIGFGVIQNFTDPKAPSSRESVILQPDKSVTGGMKVVREAGASKAAEGYTPGS